MNTNKPQWLFWVATLSVLAAVGTHIYLINHHYDFKYGTTAAESLCNINETFNCNKTTVSQYSELFGVPIAVFGALVNFALLCLLLVFKFPVAKNETRKALTAPIKIITLGVFAISLIMGSISIFALSTICPMCSLAYALSLITFASSWAYFSGGLNFSSFTLKVLGATGLTVLAFGFFFHHNNLRKYGGKEAQEIAQLQLEQWRNAEVKNINPVSPLSMHPSPEAKVKMVEFADFLCGHCASAFPMIHSFAKAHPDIEFSFQAFPLDGECNKAISRTTGIQCMLARVSQCAGAQDKAWQTQEWLFKNQRDLLSQEAIKQKLKENAPQLGLNYDQLLTCVDSDETRQIIRDQANLGVEAGVRGTPTLFINGKKIPSGFNIPLLERIYSEAR